MRIAIPITPSDVARRPDGTPQPGATVQQSLEASMRCFVHFGGLEQHHILLVPTPSQAGLAQDALEDFQRTICPNTRIAAVDSDPRGRWPVAANNHFAQTCRLVASQPEEMPWLWYELDSFPDQVGWLDRIATGLQQSGRNKFLGHVIDTEFVDNEGIRSHVPGDTLMLGVAVYPHEMGLLYVPDEVPAKGSEDTNWRLGVYHMLLDLGRSGDPRSEGFTGVAEPFDWYLRHQIKRGGRQHTDLIADQWNTYNYRLEEGQLMCDAGSLRPDAPNGRPRGGAVNPQAVLVHGCKDLSGHKLAAAGEIPRTVYVPPTAERRYFAVGTPAQRADGSEDPMLKMLEGQNKLMAMLIEGQNRANNLLEQMAPKHLAGEPTLNEDRNPGLSPKPSAREKFIAQEAEKVAALPTATNGKAQPTAERILAFMGGTAKTVKQISEELAIDREEVVKEVESCPRLVLRPGHAQWVNVVEEEAA